MQLEHNTDNVQFVRINFLSRYYQQNRPIMRYHFN